MYGHFSPADTIGPKLSNMLSTAIVTEIPGMILGDFCEKRLVCSKKKIRCNKKDIADTESVTDHKNAISQLLWLTVLQCRVRKLHTV